MHTVYSTLIAYPAAFLDAREARDLPDAAGLVAVAERRSFACGAAPIERAIVERELRGARAVVGVLADAHVVALRGGLAPLELIDVVEAETVALVVELHLVPGDPCVIGEMGNTDV